MLDATRPLNFEGPVQCLAQPRPGDWRLRGHLRSADAGVPSGPVELLLSGVRFAASPLPLRLHELCVQPLADPHRGQRAFGLQLSAREGSFALEAQALRLHRDVSQRFYPALPRIALRRGTRIGWAALLTLLRIPLISRRLLKRPAEKTDQEISRDRP